MSSDRQIRNQILNTSFLITLYDILVNLDRSQSHCTQASNSQSALNRGLHFFFLPWKWRDSSRKMLEMSYGYYPCFSPSLPSPLQCLHVSAQHGSLWADTRRLHKKRSHLVGTKQARGSALEAVQQTCLHSRCVWDKHRFINLHEQLKPLTLNFNFTFLSRTINWLITFHRF